MGTPSDAIQMLKPAGPRSRQPREARLLRLWVDPNGGEIRSFWQARFCDFNVWSLKKKTEELHYMHMNPVKRGP